jgi:dihydroflavonol-4-reductase
MRQALDRGFQVRVLVRSTSPRANLAGLPVEIVEGDMRDAASMTRAMAGVRYLFHVAADYRLWAPDPEEIVRSNVEGTVTVMNAARAAGVERVIYTSSVATLRVAGATAPVDETAAMAGHEAIGAYKRSKVLAEREVERLVAEGLPAVIVNPSTPIGPRDVRPTPTGRIIVEAATGKIPAFVDTGLNLVHVDDVANGHFLALDKGASASAISWAARTCCCGRCWPTSRAWPAARRQPSSCRAGRSIRSRAWPRPSHASPARSRS